MNQLWVVRFLFATPPRTEVCPQIFRVIRFSGDTIWGAGVVSNSLVRVNAMAPDGSGRAYQMKVYETLGAAEAAADDLRAAIDADILARSAEVAERDAEIAARRVARHESIWNVEAPASL